MGRRRWCVEGVRRRQALCSFTRSHDLLDFAEEILLADMLLRPHELPLERSSVLSGGRADLEAVASGLDTAPGLQHLQSAPSVEPQQPVSPRQSVVAQEQRLLNAPFPFVLKGFEPTAFPSMPRVTAAADRPTTLRLPRHEPAVHINALGELPASASAWGGAHPSGQMGQMPSGRGEWVAQAGGWMWVNEPVTRTYTAIDQVLRESVLFWSRPPCVVSSGGCNESDVALRRLVPRPCASPNNLC